MTAHFRFDTAFEEQASRTPGHVALRYQGSTITYAELDTSANRVANTLYAARIPSGAFIGLHAERTIQYVAAMLGILKAGAVVVPLPPAWPADRVSEILEFARFDAVIDSSATPIPSGSATRTIHLEDAFRGDHAAPPQENRKSVQPAFVICSSGSTGAPKMIVRSHESFLHRLQWTWHEHPYQADDVCVQKSFQATTHSIYELFEPLLRGVAVRIVPDEALRDLAAFWGLLTAEYVTRLLIVPSMLQASLDLPGFSPPPLRVMVLMGEHVPGPLATRAVAAFPAATKLYSIYGSSEASSTLVCDLRDARPADDDPPLGKPITSDVKAIVLTDQLEPVSPGGTGMLYMAGSPLFMEYFRNPEGTEAALLTGRESEPLYRTSDNVRVQDDGSIVFTGRADNVVKVRGFRVDLGEVERLLSRAPGVSQCVVTPQPNAMSASTLVGHVIPATVNHSEVFSWLREHLPSYMLPSVILAVDEFPRTPSGKVDRRRLATEYSQPTSGSSDTDYESETERIVARVWAALLGIGAVDRDRSFFEIGGTSLTVFAAAHRIREAIGLTPEQLGAATLYDFPTLAALADAIDRMRRGETPVSASQSEQVLVQLKRGAASGLLPLFCVSAAGGTLGAYDKVIRAMKTPREIVGLRDPFLSGGRDPSEGFQRWVRHYTDAVRRKQPHGPYHILAYSSAGAFGYEIAQQLRADGEEVAFLALVDPVAMDIKSQQRFGHWALWARFQRSPLNRFVRWGGELRALVPMTLRPRRTAQDANNWTLSKTEYEAFSLWARTDRENIQRYAALLEVSTGQPFSVKESELRAVDPSAYVKVLLERIAQVDPSVDANMIEKILVQYELQAQSQHHYRLQRYDRTVHLFEPAGPQCGLIAAQLRPFVRKLYSRSLPITPPSDRVRELLRALHTAMLNHFSCMRNEVFAERLAAELDAALESVEHSR